VAAVRRLRFPDFGAPDFNLADQRPYWKYPFTSRTKCTEPADPFITLIVPPFAARRTTALLARVTPGVKLMLLTSGGPAASPGYRAS
jgi:hypothetical protein